MTQTSHLTYDQAHGQLRKATEEIRGKILWDCLRKGYLNKETQSTIVAAQDQAH